MCDVVHALFVQRVEAQVLAERQVAAVMLAAGAEDVEIPTLQGALDDLDEWLLSDFAPVESGDRELLEALGVGRG